ncbi:MAG: beta-N-acetylhexosaminidase [Proteobacteria bacterium]|nr:beta-N-acetylhexosaminidase [Pseudomonadota bacterium]
MTNLKTNSKIQESERLAGRVIVAGFDGTRLPDDLKRKLEDRALGGVILFKRNVESYKQVASLLGEVRRTAPMGFEPLAGVDQEGGRVVRLGAPLTVLPAPRRFGEINDPELTSSAGRLVGRELRALGFTINFAPLLDVDTNIESPIIGDRSFGKTPEQVIRHGFAFARGLRDGGSIPCAKHFPGHGDAVIDSHVSLPRVEHDRERLLNIEMEPFVAWARTGLGPVMTAHVVYPSLDPDKPATASRAVIRGELRDGLNFKGAVLSDDLEMGAVTEYGDPTEIASQAIRAGVDGLLICRSPEIQNAVQEALASESCRSPAFTRQLEIAANRLALLAHPPGPPVELSWIKSDVHAVEQSKTLRQLEEVTE